MNASSLYQPGSALEFDWRKTASIGWWLQHLSDSYQENPVHMITEFLLVGTILWLIFKPEKQSLHRGDRLTPREEEEIIAEWKPDPLVPEHLDEASEDSTHGYGTGAVFLDSAATARVTTSDSKELVNLASHNYLGLANDSRVKEAAIATIKECAVGSCGPRAFYGTMDCHLDLEKALSEYFDSTAIIYPDYIGLNASVITAFAKRGDLLFIDNACHFMITQGAVLSRANIIWYPHNDMEELESYLQNVQEEDHRYNRPLVRRFIITEGVFHNNGNIANLKELVRLKEEYKYRLILDDSHALGTLHPKGSAGYWGIPQETIEVYLSSLDTGCGGTGGFCVGSYEVTFHQRLGGAGYVFTASAPPFQCTAAQVSLGIMETEEGAELCQKVQANAKLMRGQLTDTSGERWTVVGNYDISPLIHIRLNGLREWQSSKCVEDAALLCREKGVLVFPTAYLPQEYGIPDRDEPKPSLRIVVTAQHSDDDISQSAAVIVEVLDTLLNTKEMDSSDYDFSEALPSC